MTVSPATFFATVRLRELMFRAHRPLRVSVLARYLKVDRHELGTQVEQLVLSGIVRELASGAHILTDEGEASVRWSAPPPADDAITSRWVTELVRALADHYAVAVTDMLRAEIGPAVVARSRLCYALYARGWAFERIEEHFGLVSGWAHRAVERWKRLRDQNLPRTGSELRAWRERLGLTQAQAAERLGVAKRTIRRSERMGTFSARTALGRC